MLSAGHQARPEAGAQRTLEGVACMPSLGWGRSLEPHMECPLVRPMPLLHRWNYAAGYADQQQSCYTVGRIF
jgi:hypothetical protein